MLRVYKIAREEKRVGGDRDEELKEHLWCVGRIRRVDKEYGHREGRERGRD